MRALRWCCTQIRHFTSISAQLCATLCSQCGENVSQFFRNRLHGWIQHRNIETQIIETAYQERRSEVVLEQIRIDFEKCMQCNQSNPQEQCLVISQSDCRGGANLREERFYSEIISTANSYGSAQAWCPFLDAWLNSSAGKKALVNYSSAIDACIEGILHEAKQDRSSKEAEVKWMIEQLRSCKDKPRRDTARHCLHLYTRESFLFRVLNTAIRDGDHSKLQTMGPLCFLMRSYSNGCKEFVGKTYRGVNLSPAAIETYKQAINLWRTWPSYTSTTKSRSMAEIRGNTLLIIKVIPLKLSSTSRAYDIENISQFPSEEEVLLSAGISFQIISVNDNPCGKTIIEVEV